MFSLAMGLDHRMPPIRPALPRNEDGTLPAHKRNHPVYYLSKDATVFCPDCANGKNNSKASEFAEDHHWLLIVYCINYKGAACDHCGK